LQERRVAANRSHEAVEFVSGRLEALPQLSFDPFERTSIVGAEAAALHRDPAEQQEECQTNACGADPCDAPPSFGLETELCHQTSGYTGVAIGEHQDAPAIVESVELKLLIKQGAILAAANWQTVVIQFAGKTTFQALLAVPLIGAAFLVTVLLGADVANLVQGSIQEIFSAIAGSLISEPIALASFVLSFAIVMFGGSVLMFLIKGGTVEVLLSASHAAPVLGAGPLSWEAVRAAARFAMSRFVGGCRRLFRRYLRLGLLLMLVYGISGALFLAFVVVGYRLAEGRSLLIGWTFVAALAAAVLIFWITIVNLLYLLAQIAIAAEDATILEAFRIVARLIRTCFRELTGVFLMMLLVVAAATFASALAWSGVGLIAFIPLIGLAVIPLQLAALVLRGLAFEYIGLTALGAYMTSYRQHAAALRSVAFARASSASHPAS
jgi:hypothetical protein